ncbi:hypothetical protein [Chlorogloeopsis sp. ULAP02]|uniref:hypothetical protein n=1 Tax=Chlorogloeopsis sp. ULAP02 TaxID=3107926 RepID=UPI0031361580
MVTASYYFLKVSNSYIAVTQRQVLYAGEPLLTEAAYSPRSQATPVYRASTPVACGGATAVDGFPGIKQVVLETLPRALAHHRTGSPTKST